MSGKLMGSVYEYEVNASEQRVLLAMADHADDAGRHVFPSQGLLAWKLSLSVRQVRRAMTTLRKKGALVEVVKASHHRPTEFRINLAALKRKAPRECDEGRADIHDRPQNRADMDGRRADISSIRADTGDRQGGHSCVPLTAKNHHLESSNEPPSSRAHARGNGQGKEDFEDTKTSPVTPTPHSPGGIKGDESTGADHAVGGHRPEVDSVVEKWWAETKVVA
jgi:hypothetical protein